MRQFSRSKRDTVYLSIFFFIFTLVCSFIFLLSKNITYPFVLIISTGLALLSILLILVFEYFTRVTYIINEKNLTIRRTTKTERIDWDSIQSMEAIIRGENYFYYELRTSNRVYEIPIFPKSKEFEKEVASHANLKLVDQVGNDIITPKLKRWTKSGENTNHSYKKSLFYRYKIFNMSIDTFITLIITILFISLLILNSQFMLKAFSQFF